VPKFTAASTIGNSQIFDNGTNVGIGTASPTLKFQVIGDIASSTRVVTDLINGYNGGSTPLTIQTGGAQNLIFGTNNTERLRITSGGNVGIGTASPNGKLDVANAGDVAIWATATSAGSAALYLYPSGGGVAQIASVGAVPLQMLTNGAERMRIFANGRIGVNTTTDAGYQFDVNGTGRFQGTLYTRSGTAVGIEMASTSAIRNSGTQYFDYGTGGSGDFYFRGGSGFANVLTLMNGGNVGIGTTSPQRKVVSEVVAANDFNYAATSANLGVIGNWVGYLYGFAGNTYQKGATFFESIDGNARGKFHIAMNDAATSANVTLSDARLTVTSAGNVGIGTASPAVLTHISSGYIAPTGGFDANVRLAITNSGSNDRFAGVSINSGSIGGSFINFGDTDDENVGQLAYFHSDNHMRFTVNAAERGRINSAGEWIIDASGTDAGDYKLQVAGNIYASGLAKINDLIINGNSPFVTGANVYTNGQSLAIGTQGANLMLFFTNNTQRGRINSAGEWIIDASGTDAGDYKLQVSGNALVTAGKLDISSNTAFSMNVQRSGTSEVAGTFNNSNAILYLGAESSAGGAIFTGSSSYAAVIGSGAAYPLQFATNNVTRATINTNGELLINTTTDNGDFKLQVNGNALISGSIKTANGASSTAQPWHLGSVVATNVQLDTANYVEVEINGTFYRLAIVTPL
jgi:hypothetical protein